MLKLTLLLLLLLTLSHSCQEIRVKAKDGGVAIGRSMEFSVPFESYILTNPAGTEIKTPALPNCPGEPFTFNYRYKTITTQAIYKGEWLNTTSDGVNEAGLTAAVLYFKDNAVYLDPADVKEDSCGNAVPQTMLVQYILAVYETVEQVKIALESGKFPAVWSGLEFGHVIPLHYSIFDKSGAGLVLEHVREGVKWYDNTVGVITNSPTYPWHMENLRNYPHFQRNDNNREGFKYSDSEKNEYSITSQWTGSGLLGLPGDYTSPSRFVKAATLLALAPQPSSADEAVVQVFHHMGAADIPYGIVETGPRNRVSYNQWTMVKDLGRGCVYYRNYVDLSVKRLCLDDIPGVKSAVKMEWDFQDGFRDTAGELKSFDSIIAPSQHSEL